MKTIEELAREAGDDWDSTLRSDRAFLERFAALVRAQAMEQAALICEAMDYLADDGGGWPDNCADAIRSTYVQIGPPICHIDTCGRVDCRQTRRCFDAMLRQAAAKVCAPGGATMAPCQPRA